MKSGSSSTNAAGVYIVRYSRSASADSSLATRSSSWATRSAMLPLTAAGKTVAGPATGLGLLGDQLLPPWLLLPDLAFEQPDERAVEELVQACFDLSG